METGKKAAPGSLWKSVFWFHYREAGSSFSHSSSYSKLKDCRTAGYVKCHCSYISQQKATKQPTKHPPPHNFLVANPLFLVALTEKAHGRFSQGLPQHIDTERSAQKIALKNPTKQRNSWALKKGWKNTPSSTVGPSIPFLSMFARKVTTFVSSESLIGQKKLLGADLLRTGHLCAESHSRMTVLTYVGKISFCHWM